MKGLAAIPLLSAADSSAFSRFSQAFLTHHPGYRLVRPALLPLVLPRALALRMWRTTAAVLEGLKRVPQRRFGGDADAWVRALGYLEAEVPWLAEMADRRSIEIATSCARADFVMGAQGPRLVEVNVGPTIGGIGVLDRYADVFEAICGKSAVWLPRPVSAWVRTLREFAPSARPLRVALVIAEDEAGIPHPHEAAHYLRRASIAAEVVSVEALRFEGASAGTPSGPIDIVYGCFTFDQLREPRYRRFADRAMACQAAGGPVYFSPPVFTLFGNKAMLAQIDARDLPEPELLAPTRLLDAATRALAIEDRASQVLKPAIGYGGEGVVIGADCTPAAWRAALDRALDSRKPHVLQDYVAPAAIRIPSPEGDTAYHVGIGCLAFGGRFGGFLLRQTPAAAHGIANCKQGATFAAGAIAA